jgi:hypothetical protein
MVIQGVIGALFEDGFQTFFGAGGGDDGHADIFCQLDGGGSDAAAAAVD